MWEGVENVLKRTMKSDGLGKAGFSWPCCPENYFLRQGLLCSLGWPRTHFVEQAGLKNVTLLPQRSSAGIASVYHHT
jgi:hypothetical protein